MSCLGWRCITGTWVMRLKLLFLVVSVCNFASFIYIVLSQNFWHFKRPKRTTSFPAMYIYIYKKKKRSGLSRVCLGRPGSWSTRRVSRANSSADFYLDLNRSRAWVGRVPSWPAGPVRVLKLCFLSFDFFYI
jgi:hypothetical protein